MNTTLAGRRAELRFCRPRAGDVAFTLIELLVVIAVISALAALSLPTFSRAKANARSAQCKSNLHQIGVAMSIYVSDFNTFPMVGYAGPYGPVDWVYKQPINTDNDQSAFMANGPLNEQHAANFHSKDVGVFSCPSDVWREEWDTLVRQQAIVPGDYGSSYKYNEYGLGGYGPYRPFPRYFLGLGVGYSYGYDSGIVFGIKNVPTRESDVVEPSEMMAWADGVQGSTDGVLAAGAFARYGSANLGGWDPTGPEYVQTRNQVYARHLGVLNVGFCDAHVEAVKIQTLFFDISDQALRRWNRDGRSHRERLNGAW